MSRLHIGDDSPEGRLPGFCFRARAPATSVCSPHFAWIARISLHLTAASFLRGCGKIAGFDFSLVRQDRQDLETEVYADAGVGGAVGTIKNKSRWCGGRAAGHMGERGAAMSADRNAGRCPRGAPEVAATTCAISTDGQIDTAVDGSSLPGAAVPTPLSRSRSNARPASACRAAPARGRGAKCKG